MILSPDRVAAITTARADKPKMRERDLANVLGIREAEILAAELGHGVRRIAADPDRLLAHPGAWRCDGADPQRFLRA